MNQFSLSNMSEFVGRELGVSDWVLIDQERINAFADCTGDHQWIHVDVERAQRESPLGSTIAHGFLTLSLLPDLTENLGLLPSGAAFALNYGTDKVRFLSPVVVNSRLRVRVTLESITEKGSGRWLMKTNNVMEIEGQEKPAMVADTLAMIFG
ncbi:MAG: MaoC family dehydratase [Ardenticatenaceae bacterium]|nr:MaoC family dehydratase [Ardenticatenaceae bacterium]